MNNYAPNIHPTLDNYASIFCIFASIFLTLFNITTKWYTIILLCKHEYYSNVYFLSILYNSYRYILVILYLPDKPHYGVQYTRTGDLVNWIFTGYSSGGTGGLLIF